MYEIITLANGSCGFATGQHVQKFWPFRPGFQPMTREEAEHIAQCFASPAGPHWTGSEIVPRLVLVADKNRILADDEDAAIITATIADSANTDPVTFEMDGQVLAQVTPEDGEARLLLAFAAGNEGTKVVVATHPKFGRNELRLEVMASA